MARNSKKTGGGKTQFQSQKKNNASRKANGFGSRRRAAGGSSSTAVADGPDLEGGASTTLYTTPGVVTPADTSTNGVLDGTSLGGAASLQGLADAAASMLALASGSPSGHGVTEQLFSPTAVFDSSLADPLGILGALQASFPLPPGCVLVPVGGVEGTTGCSISFQCTSSDDRAAALASDGRVVRSQRELVFSV